VKQIICNTQSILYPSREEIVWGEITARATSGSQRKVHDRVNLLPVQQLRNIMREAVAIDSNI